MQLIQTPGEQTTSSHVETLSLKPMADIEFLQGFFQSQLTVP